MIQKLIDYWSVWHLLLATWLFLILHRFLHDLQAAFACTMAIALAWELQELIWNRKAYANMKAQLKNSLIDIGMALIACVFCALVIGE